MKKSGKGKKKNGKPFHNRDIEHHSDTVTHKDFPIRLVMWDYGQCDPKRCSGIKLKRLGYIQILNMRDSFHGIVLSPIGTQIIGPEDIPIMVKAGLGVVDCSWKQLDHTDVAKLKIRHHRALPYFLAANTVNFGKPWRLNCAEAIAAALAVYGYMEAAEEILNQFKWGHSFFEQNGHLIEMYRQAKDANEMKEIQDKYLDELFEEQEREREREKEMENSSDEYLRDYNPNRPITPSDSDIEEEEEEM